MVKSIKDYFADWESTAFGFGYGSGEEHVLPALKTFFECAGKEVPASEEYKRYMGLPACFYEPQPSSFDYRILEGKLTPTIAWLLINVLNHQRVLEYGTSPRQSWLTDEGVRLKAFVDSKTVDELVEICTHHDESYCGCYPDVCNCGPGDYKNGPVCPNPFWPGRKIA